MLCLCAKTVSYEGVLSLRKVDHPLVKDVLDDLFLTGNTGMKIFGAKATAERFSAIELVVFASFFKQNRLCCFSCQ